MSLTRLAQQQLAHNIPVTTHLPPRELNVAQHPRHVEYNVQNHEHVMGIVVVAGCYVDPASAT